MCSVKAQRQKLVFPCGIDRGKSVLFGKALIGKPRFLFGRSEHTYARFFLCLCIRDAVFHQAASVTVAFCKNPQAINVQIPFPDNRNPRSLKRSVLDKNAFLCVELAEHMAFTEPLCKPRALCFNSGTGFLCADNAAKIFLR